MYILGQRVTLTPHEYLRENPSLNIHLRASCTALRKHLAPGHPLFVNKSHKTNTIDLNKFLQDTKETLVVPPPQWTHVDLRPKPQKTSNSNSPNIILFVNQREIAKFPQYKKLQLVTLFLVCLRLHPFFELSPKNSNLSKVFKFPPNDPFFSPLSPSQLLRDHTLILFYSSPVYCNLHFQYTFSFKSLLVINS
jgi:hypothetical protein